MKLPDWVLNGTTYEDIGKVSDYSMGWNFNTREKARLTGGLCGEGTWAWVVIKQEEEMVAFRLLQTSRIAGDTEIFLWKSETHLGFVRRELWREGCAGGRAEYLEIQK